MNDTTSTYRQVRLVLQVPVSEKQGAYYSLHVVGVKRGIPTSTILLDGVVRLEGRPPTQEAILEALDAALHHWML